MARQVWERGVGEGRGARGGKEEAERQVAGGWGAGGAGAGEVRRPWEAEAAAAEWGGGLDGGRWARECQCGGHGEEAEAVR